MPLANELRLGNKLYRTGMVITVDALSIFDIFAGSNEYEPIPLTPEILESAGLKVKTNICGVNWTIHASPGKWFTISKNSHGDFWRTWWDCVMCFYVELKYLHQLQNLFHSLTGNELKINLCYHYQEK